MSAFVQNLLSRRFGTRSGTLPRSTMPAGSPLAQVDQRLHSVESRMNFGVGLHAEDPAEMHSISLGNNASPPSSESVDTLQGRQPSISSLARDTHGQDEFSQNIRALKPSESEKQMSAVPPSRRAVPNFENKSALAQEFGDSDRRLQNSMTRPPVSNPEAHQHSTSMHSQDLKRESRDDTLEKGSGLEIRNMDTTPALSRSPKKPAFLNLTRPNMSSTDGVREGQKRIRRPKPVPGPDLNNNQENAKAQSDQSAKWAAMLAKSASDIGILEKKIKALSAKIDMQANQNRPASPVTAQGISRIGPLQSSSGDNARGLR